MGREAAQSGQAAMLAQEGYCIYPDILQKPLLTELRRLTDLLIDSQDEAHMQLWRSTGSMIDVFSHPIFAELIALPAALGVLANLGWPDARFSSGYIISKPPGGPPLFWHQDWDAWDDPASFDALPHQLFLMYYLIDTTRENGCLRVIPGSHRKENAFHEILRGAHSTELSEAKDLSQPEFQLRPDEIDVPAKAGELVLGDARLLHAAHANNSNKRRTVITLWYHPAMAAYDERTQAHIARAVASRPANWPDAAWEKIEPILARYAGNEAPFPRNVFRPARPQRQ